MSSEGIQQLCLAHIHPGILDFPCLAALPCSCIHMAFREAWLVFLSHLSSPCPEAELIAQLKRLLLELVQKG